MKDNICSQSKKTGIATIINPSAIDLGGSLRRGRNFAITDNYMPEDMTWYNGTMLSVCNANDKIYPITIETGYITRSLSPRNFGLKYPKGDTPFDQQFGGYYVIGRGSALAYTGENLYLWGISHRSTKTIAKGPEFRSYAQLYELKNFRAIPIGERNYFSDGEEHAYSLEFDGQHLYMSGADTDTLYIVDENTGTPYPIGEWHFTRIPEGFRKNEFGDIHDIKKNTSGSIDITGITFDGYDMFAVDAFTNSLYKLERN